MKINKYHYLTIFILISLILLSFPQTLLSQEERLAVISKYKGQVKVQRDTVWKNVSKIGNRIRNSSVYNEDTVLTMPVSTADLVFSDNTLLEVNEDTTLTISTRQMTDEERAQKGFIRKVAGTQKGICRNINLKVGKIWANITPSKSILTEFEMPTGVASVRGSQAFMAHRVRTTVDVRGGVFGFLFNNGIGTAELEKGAIMEVFVDKNDVTVRNMGKKSFTIKNRDIMIKIGRDSTLSATINPKTREIKVIDTNGEVTKDEKDVKPGDIIGDASGADDRGVDDSGADDSTAVYGEQVLGTDEGGDEDETEVDAIVVDEEKNIVEENYFNPGEISQNNQTQQESSNSPPPPPPPSPSEFSDDFSSGLGQWDSLQNVFTTSAFGPITSPDDSPFAVVHNGWEEVSGLLGKTFEFAEEGLRNIKFDYSFFSGEYPEFVGTEFNDYFTAELHLSDGSTVELAHEEVNESSFTFVSEEGFFPMLDVDTGGQTNWESYDDNVFVPSGTTELHFHVEDLGDELVDAAVFIDNVVDPLVDGDIDVVTTETSPPSTDYLLTFARAIGDINSHDMDDPGVAVSNLTSIIHSDNDFAVNLDAIRDSLVVVKEFMENHINDFGDAINHNEIKAQLDSLVAKIDAARENTGDISTLRSEIETVLVSIIGDHIAHCKENSVNCENLHHL